MKSRARALILPWPVALAGALALLLGGAVAMWLAEGPARDRAGGSEPSLSRTHAGSTPEAASSPANAPLRDVAVTLTPDMVSRAGIKVATVGTSTEAGRVRIPGVVQANGYRQVIVTPLVAGRITRVRAELGQRVAPGQSIAEIYSPELADAQTQYLSKRAEFEAAHQQLKRTERLVEIGAASRQELEQVQAEHTRHETELEGARARLILLGIARPRLEKLTAASEMTATVAVPAPIAGVVTARQANVGLNVDAATPLFTVVDLSTVWIVGDLYERDFSKVRVGSPATVTTAAYPGMVLEGRVSYIDPQIREESRTAPLRVEVPNRDGKLRLGMYADVSVGDSKATPVLVIPRSAVQTVGDRYVVYLVSADQQGRFTEREVQIGESVGDRMQVLAGLAAGDVVVSEGTFFVRAERERMSPRAAPATSSPATTDHKGTAPSAQTAESKWPES